MMSELSKQRHAELEEEFYEEWHPGQGTNMLDMLVHKIIQLEAELKSRTETLDAIEDGKTAEYWRTCFYHQQDLQKNVEAENKELQELFVYFFGENYKELAKG